MAGQGPMRNGLAGDRASGTPRLRRADGQEHPQGPSDPSRHLCAGPGAARPRQFAGPAEATQQGRLLRTAVSVTAGPAAIRLRCPALTPSPVRHRAGFRPQALSPPQPQPPPTWQSRERASGTAPSASARRLPAEVPAVERRGGTYSELTWGPGG